jgi:hypothetical protein
LGSLTTSSHNLPSDRVWYDSLSHSGLPAHSLATR